MKWIAFCISVLLIVTASYGADNDAILNQGRAQTERFYQGEFEALWETLTPQMQQHFGTRQKLEQFQAQVSGQMGAETKIVLETVESANGLDVYLRTAQFAKLEQPFHVQWAFDQEGKTAGFFIKPAPQAAESKYLDYTTKSDLRLPFAGTWYVFWGGRKIEQNYHAKVVDQRFAYDILIMKEGKSYAGDGKKNEDFYCFGRPILAPANGRVHAMENSVPDNIPGQMNPRQTLGNYVIIDHGNGEFSFLAHFQKGTVEVKPGEMIKAGQQLGLCGNSGNSSEAHLHYHLQTTHDFGKGEGLPAQFQNYTADGIEVKRGEPVKGEQVAGGAEVISR